MLAAARASLPERVRAWLDSLRASWRSGDLLFVHAGVNPHFDLEEFLAVPWNTPLASLDEERHWAWVRWPFLEHRPGPGGFSGVFVVHGHTPNDARRDASHKDQIAGFRLNLDAGSGLTGVAKMAIIRGREGGGGRRARADQPRAHGGVTRARAALSAGETLKPTTSAARIAATFGFAHPSGIPALRMPSKTAFSLSRIGRIVAPDAGAKAGEGKSRIECKAGLDRDEPRRAGPTAPRQAAR